VGVEMSESDMCYLNCSYDNIMISLLEDKLLHTMCFIQCWSDGVIDREGEGNQEEWTTRQRRINDEARVS